MLDEDNCARGNNEKENNLSFYRDGYTIAATRITDFSSLTPLFKAMQELYTAISILTQSFGQRTHRQNKPIACKKGCSWCCFQPVYITTQEALLLYEYILNAFEPAQIKNIQDRAEKKLAKTKNLSEEKKQQIIHACPFLVDNSCSVYSVRPMACRIYLSQDEGTCKKKYDNPGCKTVVPALFDFPLKTGRYLNEGFVAFLKSKNKTMEEMTIEAFMVKLFNQPDYSAKWLTQNSAWNK
ncbi:Putative zinc-or iron-chelating domain-containing protein [Saccharicrinis carchari]|uniref:Zinc-or iron-chelating domain-containing protein n=1 Tax=Saccharicrinis carchari TaxID=1168039 RepID=A0A521BYP1_SACCC|nr:YkgJ family cysteine cluster protein [Saccharicrinis carchari]SMO52309.1 Putative zinc-or iron-chelating domain-containing protein [Saccharicrinis carchari]